MNFPRLVDVVPLVNLPRGKDQYTYAVPDGVKVHVGDLVRIPFRSGMIDGVVWDTDGNKSLMQFTPRKLSSVGAPVLTQGQLHLIERCCRTLGGSRATLSKFWVQAQKKILSGVHERKRQTAYQQHCLAGPTSVVLKKVLTTLQEEKPGAQQLILVPTKEIGQEIESLLRSLLPGSRILFVHASHRKSEITTKLETLQSLSDQPTVVIAPHMGLFLPWRMLTSVFVIDEEHAAHRQWDSEPRIDNRIVAQWLSQEWGSMFIVTSVAPTLATIATAQEQTLWSTSIFENPSLSVWSALPSSDEPSEPWAAWARDYLESGRSVLVMGGAATSSDRRSWCASCQQLFRCPTCGRALVIHPDDSRQWYCWWCRSVTNTIICPHCKGTRMRTPASSLERLARTMESVFPEFSVQTVASSGPIPMEWSLEPSIIILPARTLFPLIDVLRWAPHPTPWPALLIWSLETTHSVGYRQEEQQWQTLLSLMDILSEKKLPSLGIRDASPWIANTIKTQNWWNAWYEHEQTEREQFQYPPERHLILLDTHSQGAHNSKDLEHLLSIPGTTLVQQTTALARRKGYAKRTVVLLRTDKAQDHWEIQCRTILAALPAGWSFTLDPEILPAPLHN